MGRAQKGRALSRWQRLGVVWLPLLVLAVTGGWLMAGRDVAAAAPTVPVAQPGPVLYEEYCSACHGTNGLGTTRAPSLKGVGEAAVDFELTTGRMPKKGAASKEAPYRGVLPAAAISTLDQYITALVATGGPAIPRVNAAAGDVADGQELFAEDCAACHGIGGSGGILFDRPIPQVTEATPTQVGEAIRVGPAEMPVFGPAEISRQQVDDIAAYIDSLKHPADEGGNGLSHVGPVAEGAIGWLVAMVGLIMVTRVIGKRG
jgi:ubiquinol-cytochrome c reductase cytochrome c subunit